MDNFEHFEHWWNETTAGVDQNTPTMQGFKAVAQMAWNEALYQAKRKLVGYGDTEVIHEALDDLADYRNLAYQFLNKR